MKNMAGRKTLERQADKVAIVGAGYSWKQTPFGDKDIEIWGLNAFWRFRPPPVSVEDWEGYFSRWFQIHLPGSNEGHIDDKDNLEWLKDRKGPIYMVRRYEEWPGSEEYPIDEVADKFGPTNGGPRGRRYFTSTIDYMIGLALLLGFPEIHCFGIDLISDTDNEYQAQRQSLEYYMGKAEGLGRKIFLPEGSAMLRSDHVYGFERQPEGINNLIRHMEGRMGAIAKEQDKHFSAYNEDKANYHRAQGAQSALQAMTRELRCRQRGLPI